MSRLSRLASPVFNVCKLSRTDVALFKGSHCLHSSSKRLNTEVEDVVANNDLNTAPKKGRHYYDSVVIIGDVAAEPQPLIRVGEVIGYKLKLSTEREHYGNDASVKLDMNEYDAVCYRKQCFPYIEKQLKVDDQVLVRGTLLTALSKAEDSAVRNTTVQINSIQPMKSHI